MKNEKLIHIVNKFDNSNLQQQNYHLGNHRKKEKWNFCITCLNKLNSKTGYFEFTGGLQLIFHLKNLILS